MQKRTYTTLPYTEYTVAEGHYDTTRKPIKYIVLHSSASTKQGLINTFAGGSRMVSAHYGIDLEGNIMAFLEEYNTSFANGNYTANQESITIEHVDNAKPTRSDAQYETSARLVADICKFYGWDINTSTVKIHSEIVPTACPNGLDRERILKRARDINNSTPPSMNTIQVDTKVYETLVKQSTQFSAVCAYLSIASDPKDVMFEDIQKVIAGIKGALSSSQSQTAEANRQLAAALQEVKNRTEQVSRLNKELLDNQTVNKTLSESLQNSITSAKIDLAKQKIELDEVYKSKGEALNQLAEVTAQLEACKSNVKPQPPVNTGGLNAIIDWFIKQFIKK